MSKPAHLSQRRQFLSRSAIGIAAYYAVPKHSSSEEPTADSDRPNITSGVWTGDVGIDSAVLCVRSDRPAQMIVEVASNERFDNARKILGPNALSNTDFVAKMILGKLTPGRDNYYRVQFRDLASGRRLSAPVTGRVLTSSNEKRNVKFAWSGDTAGQGFGIDEAHGGMKTYDSIRKIQPDFFVHCGDTCYADGPFSPQLTLDDGAVWNNIVTEQTTKVAETLGEFHANHRYNLMDRNVRSLNREVPTFFQWDDHEVVNNWFPGEVLDDDRYTVKSASLLAARSKQAFFDYMPLRARGIRQTIHRQIPYGPMLDLFFLDQRSFRGPNSRNDQEAVSNRTRFMGLQQVDWLKQRLLSSTATWKVICSDMPIGMIVRDGENFENAANGNGPVKGREFELADLLSFIKRKNIRNVMFITADVHHAASHYYDPNFAQFHDFDPFWEFVSGPLHAGTFGPSEMDNTFGPQVKFCSVPSDMKQNRPPSDNLQFFGVIELDAETLAATVKHHDRNGKLLWSKELAATVS